MPPTTSISIRLPNELAAELDQRITSTSNQHQDSLSFALRESLFRYFTLLKATRRTLRGQFSPNELSALADAMNGTFTYQESGWVLNPLIAFEVEDSLPELAEKWGIDGAELVQRLSGLTPVEHVALLDAVERFWSASGKGEAREAGRLLEK